MSVKKDLIKLKFKIIAILNKPKYSKFKNEYFAKNYSETKRLIVFFVPDGAYRINGGILSICTIYKTLKTLKSIHNCEVIASYLPGVNYSDYKYRTFENEIVIYNFSEINKKFTALDYIQIHVPEIMVELFKTKSKKFEILFDFLKKCKEVELNILNQNDLFMPSKVYLDYLKSRFNAITMTVAHKKYASLEKRNEYNLPTHLLSPWLNPVPYKVRSYEEKENLVIYSPDKIQWVPNQTNLSKEEIISNLKSKLPHYKFVEIKNLKYDAYKDLASRAKFALTFGEGLDGYFIEAVFSGGISFAVYNENFFTEEYKNLDTLYDTFDELNANIVSKINELDQKEKYYNKHVEIAAIVNKSYSIKYLETDLKEFYNKKYDFE
jgi:hypothetical protein